MFLTIAFVALIVGGVILALPQFRGWRTMIFNSIVTGVLGVLPVLAETTGFLQTLDWSKYVGPDQVPWIMLAVGLIGIWLRWATKGPVGQKH